MFMHVCPSEGIPEVKPLRLQAWGKKGGGFRFLSLPVFDYLRSFFSFPQGLIKECSSGGNCVFTVDVHPFPIHVAPVRDGVRCCPIFLPPMPSCVNTYMFIYIFTPSYIYTYVVPPPLHRPSSFILSDPRTEQLYPIASTSLPPFPSPPTPSNRPKNRPAGGSVRGMGVFQL